MAQKDTKPTIEAAKTDVDKHVSELQDLQASPDKSRELAIALTHLETASLWLEKAAKAVK